MLRVVRSLSTTLLSSYALTVVLQIKVRKHRPLLHRVRGEFAHLLGVDDTFTDHSVTNLARCRRRSLRQNQQWWSILRS